MRKPLLLAGLAASTLVAVLYAAGGAGAQDKPEPEASPSPSPEMLVQHVLTTFASAKKGLRIGMKARDAKKALEGSAHMIGTHVLALDATQYGLPGAKGTVFLYSVGEENDDIVDEMHISLLCGAFDKKALGAKVASIGKSLGFEMEADEDEDGLWSGTKEHPSRSLSVSLAGKGVILLELTGE